MNILLVPNITKPLAAEVLNKAGELLSKNGAQLILQPQHAQMQGGSWTANILPTEQAYQACDVVLTIGGDGSLLHAAPLAMQYCKPLTGINTGRLGFLTSIETDELERLLCLVRKEYTVEQRNMLHATTSLQKQDYYALNDILLFKQSPERSVAIDIHCDDILVSKFRGDGIIFATATGSTAYSMSAGGPILDAHLQGIVITQICAHVVHTPPLVVASSRIIRATSQGTQDETVCICCDGKSSRPLQEGESVCITQSNKTVPLIQFTDSEQLHAIDKKLKGR